MTRPLVYLGFNRWDSIKQREQHLVEHLSYGRPVLYVDPYLTLRRALANGRGDLRHLSETLSVYSPPSLFLPRYTRSASISGFNAALLGLLVRRLLDRLEIREYDLGVGHPRSAPMLAQLAPRRVYYDCMDDHLAFPVSGLNFRILAEYEERLLRCSDRVFASSRLLLDHCAHLNPHVTLVGNGVNAEHFLGLRDRDLPIPEDLRGLSGPVIGYYGAIAPWLDLDSLVELAIRRPSYQLVLIGPAEHGIALEPLTRHPNVHWLGPKRYEQLPAYLKCFDVALIPFHMSPLIEKVNPTKFYEYLAGGKPVVSAPLPDVAAHPNLARIYHEAAGFVREVDMALAEDPTVLEPERVALALANTWQEQAQRIATELDRVGV